MSPSLISDRGRFLIETISPGQSMGSMLVPETCNWHRPCCRSTSRVNSCFRPRSAIFISNLGVLSRAEMALPFHPADFTAGQRHRLEYALVTKRRPLIWFFGTTGSSGNGRFRTRPVLNLHRPSRFCGKLLRVSLLPSRGKVSQKCTPIWPYLGLLWTHERGDDYLLRHLLVRVSTQKGYLRSGRAGVPTRKRPGWREPEPRLPRTARRSREPIPGWTCQAGVRRASRLGSGSSESTMPPTEGAGVGRRRERWSQLETRPIPGARSPPSPSGWRSVARLQKHRARGPRQARAGKSPPRREGSDARAARGIAAGLRQEIGQGWPACPRTPRMRSGRSAREPGSWW